MTDVLAHLDAARAKTLAFVRDLDDATLEAWPDPAFSPLCWHLGHLAFTEAHWILARCAGDPSLSKPYARRFAQDGCAKAERAEGFERGTLFAYLDAVRELVREAWPILAASGGARPDLVEDGYVGWFLCCHEHQHRETMAIVLGLVRSARSPGELDAPPLEDAGPAPRVSVPGAQVRLGTAGRLAYDNERPPQEVELAPFALDGHPVTAASWARFMADGGYATRALWSDAGWAWKARAGVTAPRAWRRAGAGWLRPRLGGWAPIDGREPVHGVSWWEAEAYARWASAHTPGARLPTEAEWEHAARRFGGGEALALRSDGPAPVTRDAARATDLLGNVWEWTADWFEPRPGFSPYPYRGYSTPWFEATHKVMRGGSFATDPAIARPAFRNWYEPSTRQCYVGLRLAYDA